YLWSANDWLAKISHSADYTPFDADDVTSNRSTYIDDQRARYIFTWSDGDGDGIVDDGEVLDFIDRSGGTDWDDASLYTAAERGSVHKDFGDITAAEVNKIVNWVRGKDQDGMRSRAAKTNLDKDDDTADEDIIWRLGDVIHSTPMAVGRPAEAYHFLYRDDSYAVFANTYWNRRQVVYFGGNDGMMHAVNGGFYNTDDKKFYRTSNWDETDLSAAPELGAELWAYVPYNLLPHLSCLTDEDYEHKYFVDLRPRIFDVQIFDQEAACATDFEDPACIHPEGWGTILVGGMRFGGAPVEPEDEVSADGGAGSDWNGNTVLDSDDRVFTSAYVVLDITNPEEVPTLLGETTISSTNEDLDDDGVLDVDEDLDGDGNLDVDEDIDNDGTRDLVNEDLNGDGNLDVFEDVDGDNNLDVGEDING
ncbi:MAG: hypothetical protein KAI25_02395, partial [Hyphomicrobiaceae bacterium]|nr:hypothetical protein [Hyphomicrobiaceae bacterium]